MTETTQLSGKIKHKCSKTMLLTPQELFELDRCIESLRASGSFTEDEKRAVTENDFSRWETLSCGLRTWIAEKHYAEFLAAPTVPVDEAYLESSVFELSLEKWALDPAFRLALSARILADRRRNPNTVGVYERCEQKMNAYLMERALTPSAANDTQLALAAALFLAQLGGVEVVQTAKGQTGSYFLGAEATVTEPFAHGGRVAFLLPADTDFRALRPCPAVQHFALRKADGTVLRRRARESEHPARQYSADLADKHIYLRPYKGGEGRYAALTLGIQSDAPGGVSPLGHTHSDWAHSERQSGFLSCRETGVGQRFGGRIIDLTPLSSAQLTALMQAFAHGYRALQAQPEVPDALLRVGSLLTGAPLTREEMLALWSHLDADDAEALGAAFDACRSRSLEAPIKPPQLKTGDGCTFAPLTPVHIELRQNEVNWYNRVFGWLPFVKTAASRTNTAPHSARPTCRSAAIPSRTRSNTATRCSSRATACTAAVCRRNGSPSRRSLSRPAESGRSTARASCPCCSTTAASIPRSRSFSLPMSRGCPACSASWTDISARVRVRSSKICAATRTRLPGLSCRPFTAMPAATASTTCRVSRAS